jgi:2-C-methyl-D-erythritol 2,4-cyclodiphosphate synthase
MYRIGHGIDVHRFGDGNEITLGGVKIPHSHGLIAHSDGDVLLHALCDALLGACALGDIGKHFPDTDEAFANADSRNLLKHCYKLVQQQGYELANADLTIIAQTPKMAPHIDAMRTLIAQDLNAAITAINVKATTTEALGFEGRKEGISCHSVVMLRQINA